MLETTGHCTGFIDEMRSICWCFNILIERERSYVGHIGAPDFMN